MVAKKQKYKKRKNGRTSHYITGTYNAKKCKNPVNYRSSWELIVAKHLDEDPDVCSFEYESIVIPYITNKQTSRIRKYYPDFLVKYKSGKILIIEVKRQSALNQKTIQVKAEAAKNYAMQKGWDYEFWTENTIMPMKKIQEKKEK